GGTPANLTDDRGIRVTNGNGSLLLLPTGVAADISAEIELVGIADGIIDIDGLTVALQINTTPNAVVDAALGLDLPAGKFVRVQLGEAGTPVSVDILGHI